MAAILRVLGVFVLTAIAVAVWYLWPFYGFSAHRGEAPLPFWGWEVINEPRPSSSDTFVPQYQAAGDDVLAAMAQHAAAIGAPGMTAAVAVDGQLVWQGAVGFADIAKEEAMTNDHALRVGSTSKAITATALALMVDRGDIDLDTPITAYLGQDINPDWASITPRMLASHMSGIPHYGQNDEFSGVYASVAMRKHYPDMRTAIRDFDESSLLFQPGTDFEYSSLGTVLLGAVMSEVDGRLYRDLIAEEVLAPASASRTFVAPKRGRPEHNLATFYYQGEGRFRPWRPVDLSHRLPGGGWASTSVDLVRIGSLWLREGFISDETRAEFWQPQVLASGETNEQDYAIGWRWRAWKVEGAPLAWNANHGGVSRGAQSWLLVYPDLRMVIAFNINTKTEDFTPFAEFHDQIYRPFANAAAATLAPEPAPAE